MRVTIVSSLLHPSYGGPPAVVRAHADVLRKECTVNVIGTTTESQQNEAMQYHKNPECFTVRPPERWFFSYGLLARLRAVATITDVFHVHMLWDFPLVAACVAAGDGIPVVVSPHGSVIDKWRR